MNVLVINGTFSSRLMCRYSLVPTASEHGKLLSAIPRNEDESVLHRRDAMIRLGKVRGNAMSHVTPTNAKLRDRAARIVADLRKCSYDEAVARLESAKWDVPSAIDGTS